MALMCGCHIVQRQVTHRGVLVHFAILWIHLGPSGNWEEQYSVDTGHGHFHEHVFVHRRSGDRKNLRPLYSQVDVQEGFDQGCDLVQDRHDSSCRG